MLKIIKKLIELKGERWAYIKWLARRGFRNLHYAQTR